MSEFPLEDLSDEVILNILGYLKIQDLINCGQLSNRIRGIAQDKILWKRVDVNDKKVSKEFLEMVLEKGCKFLDVSLAVTLEDSLNIGHKSELRHLDVSSYFPPKQVLEKLLIANLEKLAMRNLTISQDLIFHICNKNSSSLQILNLGNCRGINPSIYRNLDFESIQIISDKCINLKEVDFSGSMGSIDSESTIRYLVNNITTNLEKINLANVQNIGDDDIHILVTRFYELENINAYALCLCTMPLQKYCHVTSYPLKRFSMNDLQMFTYCIMRKHR